MQGLFFGILAIEEKYNTLRLFVIFVPFGFL